MTVLLSSHILGEIQLICDSVTIISRGRRVAAGPVAEVLAAHSTAARSGSALVRPTTAAAARSCADAGLPVDRPRRPPRGLAGVADAGLDQPRRSAGRSCGSAELAPVAPTWRASSSS